MAFWIAASCVGCRVCAPKCPTGAITGLAKQLHVVDPLLCIECGVCASVCPVEECIFDARGFAPPKIKPAARPIAVVNADLCSGCGDCVDICRSGCLVMMPGSDGAYFPVAQMSDPKACTGCRECEQVCSDKRAMLVCWPDGTYCSSLGEVPEQWIAPRKAGALAAR